MFFQAHFASVADRLDAKFSGSRYKDQNPADIGELAESFVEEFLDESLSPNLSVYRGGKIVDVNNNQSKQLDVLVSRGNAITLFRQKGLYPVETIVGVISVTSTLDFKKLESCIEEFCSIPKENPEFEFEGMINEKKALDTWHEMHPLKCVWAFNGKMGKEWEEKLNDLVKNGDKDKSDLPDFIVINKQSMIIKTNPNSEFIGGEKIGKHFHHTNFENEFPGAYWMPFEGILNKLYIFGNWQFHSRPAYHKYFNKDTEAYLDNN